MGSLAASSETSSLDIPPDGVAPDSLLFEKVHFRFRMQAHSATDRSAPGGKISQ